MTLVDLHSSLNGHAARTTPDEPEFRCRVRTSGDWVVMALSGELDMSHIADVRTALIELQLPFGGRFALDLRGLSFMDSAGVRVLLQTMAHAERHGFAFAVVRGSDTVQRMLEVVGLADQLPIVDDLM